MSSTKRKAITKVQQKLPLEGIMMILSPAKTLDLSPYPAPSGGPTGALPTRTQPQCNAVQTLEIATIMKSRTDLVKLLGVSANVGKTAQEYWDKFELDNYSHVDDGEQQRTTRAKNPQTKPCIYAFTGMAYQGLQVQECSDEAVLYLQQNLRIIDPLYGVLRPLDEIQPYRLEMATKGVFVKDKKFKLHDYWKESVTASLAQDLKDRDCKIVLNLASDEYSSAVNSDGLPSGTRFIKVTFLDGGRVVSVHAKRARGLMAKFVAENQCQILDQVKKFDLEGYAFSQAQSTQDSLVFERSKQGTNAQKRKTSSSGSGTKKSKK